MYSCLLVFRVINFFCFGATFSSVQGLILDRCTKISPGEIRARPYCMLGTELGLASCKASALFSPSKVILISFFVFHFTQFENLYCVVPFPNFETFLNFSSIISIFMAL